MRFSVVVVSYNRTQKLAGSLDSVVAQHYPLLEIVVVDNGSGPETVGYLRSLSAITLIENQGNLGFAKANNIGAAAAKGDYVVLLNDDTHLHDRFFLRVARFLSANPTVDVLGPLVLLPDGLPQPSFYRGSYVRDLLFASPSLRAFHMTLLFGDDPSRKRAALLRYSSQYSFVTTHRVAGVSGVCMFIRKQLIDSIGLFDERYFMYVEDMDFCLRATRFGAEIVFFPEASLTHFLEPVTAKPSVPRSIYGDSLKYFFRKNFGRGVGVLAHVLLTPKGWLRRVMA